MPRLIMARVRYMNFNCQGYQRVQYISNFYDFWRFCKKKKCLPNQLCQDRYLLISTLLPPSQLVSCLMIASRSTRKSNAIIVLASFNFGKIVQHSYFNLLKINIHLKVTDINKQNLRLIYCSSYSSIQYCRCKCMKIRDIAVLQQIKMLHV